MEVTIQNHKITITPTGISFPEATSQGEWAETLRLLKAVKDGFHIAMADTIKFGREKFGDEVVAETMEQLEFSMADFNTAGNIAKIPLGLRENSEGLNAEHFHVVGRIFGDDEALQKKWLTAASKEGLSPRELRRSIDVGHVVHSDPKKSGKGSGGLVTIQAIMFSFQQWRGQVGDKDGILHWTEKNRRAWLEETRPFAELRKEVEDSLTTGPEY